MSHIQNSGVEWYDLIMRCPACIAEEKEPGPESQWFHATDFGKVQVGDTAEYRCTKCGHHEHVKNWRYACELHATEYKATTSAHLANSLSAAGQITSRAGKEWLQRFMDHLGDW
jgi:hypothetical protein